MILASSAKQNGNHSRKLKTQKTRTWTQYLQIERKGPINPADIDGNVYLQLLVDAATGHTQGFTMKKKSDAPAAKLKGIRRLKVAVGKKVKMHHSDNTKEQRTKGLLKELEAKGTRITSTAPNTSQINAIVERSFGTVFAEIRVALASSELPKQFWSLACLDAIDKPNFLPVKRSNGDFVSPNSGVPGHPTSP